MERHQALTRQESLPSTRQQGHHFHMKQSLLHQDLLPSGQKRYRNITFLVSPLCRVENRVRRDTVDPQ